MPQKKKPARDISRPVAMPLPQPPDWLDGIDLEHTLKSTLKAMQERSKKPYDGVVGTLPAWVPDNFHAEFERARNRVLDDRHEESAVKRHIAEVIATHSAALAKPQKPQIVGSSIPFRIRREVNTLAHILVAVQNGEVEGLAFLTDPTHAGQVAKGKKYGQHQSRVAKNPRGKVSDNGKTINQIIGCLARSNEETAKELWGRFQTELDNRALCPSAKDHPTDPKKCSTEYEFKDRRKSITFGTFEKVVSQYRGGKKKLP